MREFKTSKNKKIAIPKLILKDRCLLDSDSSMRSSRPKNLKLRTDLLSDFDQSLKKST